MPYLGLCLGLQMAVVEFARSVCGLRDANSAEFDEELSRRTPHPVIHLMPAQETVRWKGGTALDSLRGKSIALRFALRSGSLYAFWFETS